MPLLRLIGKRPFNKNPRYCDFCMSRLIKAEGGAEIDMSALFADVRGSTPLAEQLGPTRMREIVDRFYTAGVDVLCQGGAMVDRFMGDQIVGYFVPLYAPVHPRSAIETGLALLGATEMLRGSGAGSHRRGRAHGEGVRRHGRSCKRIARAHGHRRNHQRGPPTGVDRRCGRLVCSEAVYVASGLTHPAERREVVLKGVSVAVPVRVLRVG